MAKSSQTFLVYFAELCTYIIPNVSNNVQTRRIPQVAQGNNE